MMRVPIMKKGGGGGGYSAGASEYSTGLFKTVGTNANVYEEVFVYTGFRPMAIAVSPAAVGQTTAAFRRAIVAFAPNGVLGDSYYLAASGSGKKTAGDDNSITRITDEGFYAKVSYVNAGWTFWAIGGQGSQFVETTFTATAEGVKTVDVGFRARAIFVYNDFNTYSGWLMMCPNGERNYTIRFDSTGGSWRILGYTPVYAGWSITDLTDTGFDIWTKGGLHNYIAIA